MQNNKVLKQRATLYDNLLTCTIGDCGNKFSTGVDLELHTVAAHHQQLTANQWWSQFKKALFVNKDDLEAENVKNGLNQFSFGELSEAARKVMTKNRGNYQ